MQKLIHHTQHCGIPGRTIFNTICSLRDGIAASNYYNIKAIFVSLDFNKAFDSIKHSYLYDVLRWHGISEKFISYIQCLYTNAVAAIQVNGFLSSNIPVTKSRRQGCPASMVLFALALNPILYMLQEKISGISLGPTKLAVATYADDVSVITSTK